MELDLQPRQHLAYFLQVAVCLVPGVSGLRGRHGMAQSSPLNDVLGRGQLPL